MHRTLRFRRRIIILLFVILCCCGWTAVGTLEVEASPLPALIPASTQEAIDGETATDSQVVNNKDSRLERTAESSAVPEKEEPDATKSRSFFPKQTLSRLQVLLEQFIQVFYWRTVALDANSAKLPYNLGHAMNRLSLNNGITGFFKMLGLLAVVFTLATGAEFIFRRFVLSRFAWNNSAGSADVLLRPWIILLQVIPDVLALLFFVAASYVAYVLFYASYFSGICPIYLSLLTAIVAARTVSLGFRIFIDHRDNRLTLFSLDKKTATLVYYSITASGWIVILGIMFINLFKYAGVRGDSLLLLKLGFGTLLCLLVALAIWLNRRTADRLIVAADNLQRKNGFREQLAANWHIMGLGYLLILWSLWTVRLVVSGSGFTVAFVVSLFIVPIFLVLDRLMNRLVVSFMKSETTTLGTGGQGDDDGSSVDQNDNDHTFLSYLRLIYRMLLSCLLFVWLLYLWGYPVAISPHVINMAIEVIVIVMSAFFLWKVIDLFIRNHLASKALAQAESKEDVDSEWGDAPLLDRSQTLLPLVRKFIGIIVAVITFLTILSTLGVNIGPLLAGAGVVGIAIGFGAQKLVSDIFSGFFYLMDDAFRVGEYIEAGSISGAVEKITLRNVMLRHHRGMLQIIPYSDLGAITNFMRGGIVVKFNLQFPYDTDVDEVRKVIKRVGIAMLDDPEFGKNFINQVKSQGIREVGDSILTIRVKFTAHPGTHFVIRREAYRRITEALAAKGIYYAHRKVIVEVPSIEGDALPVKQALPLDDAMKTKIAQAGAAAHQAQQQGRADR